jgi:hypothetical protein
MSPVLLTGSPLLLVSAGGSAVSMLELSPLSSCLREERSTLSFSSSEKLRSRMAGSHTTPRCRPRG